MSGVLFKWHSHNLQQALQHMFQSESLVDVTLAVEGQLLKAHRVVLSAYSKYFSSMLSTCSNAHPIIFMRDVKAEEMRALLNFMYTGEATVSRDLLPGVFRTAEALQITGLMSTSSAEPQLYLRVDEVSQCDESDFVTLVIGSQLPSKTGDAVDVESTGPHGGHGVLPETFCLDSESEVEGKSAEPLGGGECFLVSGGLAATSPTSTVLVSAPESAVIIGTTQDQHYTRPPGRQYSRDDVKRALEQVRTGRMGIKPAARAYNIPCATLHSAARRCNISSPMQQGANFRSRHARPADRKPPATTKTDPDQRQLADDFSPLQLP